MRNVFVTVELDDESAQALAQLVKRIGWQEIRGCAIDDDEAYAMRDALGRVRDGLQEKGFAPR